MVKHKVIKVKVTKKHIKCGVKGNEYLCPIARAVRALGYKRVSVDSVSIITRNQTFSVPYQAGDFIWDFDKGQKVRPFTFIARSE